MENNELENKEPENQEVTPKDDGSFYSLFLGAYKYQIIGYLVLFLILFIPLVREFSLRTIFAFTGILAFLVIIFYVVKFCKNNLATIKSFFGFWFKGLLKVKDYLFGFLKILWNSFKDNLATNILLLILICVISSSSIHIANSIRRYSSGSLFDIEYKLKDIHSVLDDIEDNTRRFRYMY